VMGEVAKPGTFTITNEKVNIMEALAMAGDMTVYGQRNKVKLIREDAQGNRRVIPLNLNDADIIVSPYYYLQQNDVQCAQDREINVPVIVYQILLQGWLAGKAFAVCRDGGGYRQVKRNGGIGVTGVYRDGQQIFGHDVCIIQGCLDICHVQVLGTLKVGYLFVGAATA
jgi:hypothetical protein